MRIFVAVFPPPETQRALAEAARGLPVAGKVRLTPPANIHLTLKFLGDASREDLGRLAEALEPVRERHEPFEAGISGFGAFPSPKRARILWADIGEGAEKLRALARDLEESLEPLGFEREDRAYLPHLTLGRARPAGGAGGGGEPLAGSEVLRPPRRTGGERARQRGGRLLYPGGLPPLRKP